MPRKNKGVHTSPATAGVKNIPESHLKQYIVKNGEENAMTKILPLWEQMLNVRQNYEGKWTEETLELAMNEYFQYCEAVGLKPSKSGLQLSLAIGTSQYNDWERFPEKYGFKSELALLCNKVIENQYIYQSEKFPSANLFLLRTSHGHIETSKLDVTSNGKEIINPEDVADKIKKLGLSK